MRYLFFLAFALLALQVQAKNGADAPEHPKKDSLSFCGARVTTLAWFYKGIVEQGGMVDERENLNSLLHLRTGLRAEAIRRGEDNLKRFDDRSKTEIEELAKRLQASEDSGALALAELNIDVKSCVSLYFEKQE